MKQYPESGSISWGTMRPQDVLPEIMNVLAEYNPVAYHAICDDIHTFAGLTYDELCENMDDELWQSESMSIIINENAWDAMQEIAPDGCYFGASEGDGADYGFWYTEDQDEQD